MADKSLGQRLEAAGWDQGVLLPDDPKLAWAVNFHLDAPVTKIAKGGKREAESEYQRKAAGQAVPPLRHGFANGIAKAKDRWVIISQGCDIVSDPTDEPTVVAARAFTTDNGPTLDSAATNSSRYFLLDPERGLVADVAIILLIEKPLLAELTPERGITDELTRARFARWLGHRFSRPALPDEVVAAVVKPILDNIRQMEKKGDPDISVLDTFQELRIAQIEGLPPYDVRIVFIVPENEPSDGGIALARLVGRMCGWLDPSLASITAWGARSLFEISVAEYLTTFRLYLDHYTYKGRTIRGLVPPPPI